MLMEVDRYLTGAPSALFQPQVISPAQYFAPPKKLAPEHRLMMAVLEDAVRCVEKYRVATYARDRRLFHEAKQWLLAAELRWPYSFECICAVLDLDADAVRNRLRLARRSDHRGIGVVHTKAESQPRDSGNPVGSPTGIRPHTPPKSSSRTATLSQGSLPGRVRGSTRVEVRA